MAAKVSVITPVWNNAHHTIRYLLQNIHFYQNRPDVEFIIIDNGSEDNTPAILKMQQNRTDNLKVITNAKNLGFSMACNQGAKEATGDILLFLNNDILVHGDYVGMLQDTITDDMLAGPELHTRDTGWNGFSGKLVSYIAGWCLALTKKTFDELGGFDERYSPCDYEDMDLCYAASEAGKVLYFLDLPIRHQFGGSSHPDRQAITEANRRKFAEKWNLV